MYLILSQAQTSAHTYTHTCVQTKNKYQERNIFEVTSAGPSTAKIFGQTQARGTSFGSKKNYFTKKGYFGRVHRVRYYSDRYLQDGPLVHLLFIGTSRIKTRNVSKFYSNISAEVYPLHYRNQSCRSRQQKSNKNLIFFTIEIIFDSQFAVVPFFKFYL